MGSVHTADTHTLLVPKALVGLAGRISLSGRVLIVMSS
jgi:hypothetical protein